MSIQHAADMLFEACNRTVANKPEYASDRITASVMDIIKREQRLHGAALSCHRINGKDVWRFDDGYTLSL